MLLILIMDYGARFLRVASRRGAIPPHGRAAAEKGNRHATNCAADGGLNWRGCPPPHSPVSPREDATTERMRGRIPRPLAGAPPKGLGAALEQLVERNRQVAHSGCCRV